ncbi:PH domain-containing protein [Pedobacter punctiformis]|uniref:PH domain-containing protein n=1 Tax=Pedobacter punctiformis TaxID=3004097 RepID=A0ABT4LAQ7_9SPHI|nr:PH domain-containing protein [Pedobacter sp. HCMS5-2]MCZ4245011.1 PH domain-containing protein [Pedobacter sp. HCMS5-2]
MSQFENDTIDIRSIPRYEEIELNKPHRNYWKIILINLLIFLLLLALALTAVCLLVPEVKAYLTTIIIGHLTLAALLFLLFKASFKKRGYALRTHDIVYKSGIIAQSTTIIPLNRIQHIELNEGVFSRIYKLGALQIFTAGGQTGHLHITGIPIEDAKNIKELLLRKLDLTADKTEVN